jgi:hypothetical protein
MIPTAIYVFDDASSSSSSSSSSFFHSNYYCTGTKDIRDVFRLSSITKIDGPATRALENSKRISKRQLTIENNSGVSSDGGSLAAPRKKNKSTNEKGLTTNTGYTSMPLMSDWNNVYNCLISTVPVDETIPTKMNEPFPTIEFTFDDSDSIAPSLS